MALWQHSADERDRKRLDNLRASSGDDWSVVRPFRDKEEAGHEEPRYAYLSGDNPDCPDQLTRGGPQVVCNRGSAQPRVRYFDAERRRPGLPQDVAALVSSSTQRRRWSP